MSIDGSAVISSEARLGPGVDIGPGVVITGPVRLDAGCRVLAHAVIEGDVEIGEGTVVGYGAVIGAPPQDLSWTPDTPSGVRIGRRNIIRELCTIHRGNGPGSATVMGDDNYLMAGAHLGHNARLGDRVIVANNCLLGGHVQVGNGAFLGGGSVFHQHTRVGRLAITQGLSALGKDVPPFAMAHRVNRVIALNIVGLRRAGVSAERRQEIRRAFDLLYRRGLNFRQALEHAATMEWETEAREFFEFARAPSRRGLCRFGGARTGEEE